MSAEITNKELNTPVLFIIFNRPDLTQKIFNEIKRVKPKKLFVSADGARNNKEWNKCNNARKIIEQVDWDCKIEKKYSDKNLGCKIGVSSAIDWFFEKEENGIILEDDCLPNRSFFFFCEELLRYYEKDKRIGSIGGSNPFDDKINIQESYFFSKYNRIWGWATWRNRWCRNDIKISVWPKIKKEKSHHSFLFQEEIKTWEQKWDNVYNGLIDTWDYQWFLCRSLYFPYTIIPAKNLISNIGFGNEATHTIKKNFVLSNIARNDAIMPLIHPAIVCNNYRKDKFAADYFNLTNKKKYIIEKIYEKFKKVKNRYFDFS